MKPAEIRRRVAVDCGHAWPVHLHPILARIFAARGLAPGDVKQMRLADLAVPSALGGIERACDLLAAAIAADQRICVVGDFDADGATGTATAVRGLRQLGARDVCYRVPNRFRDGYGLSAGLVESLADVAPDLILTVDNGIASHAGVAAARERGIGVVVTDHHLPGDTLPDADAIVNPNLPGDGFPSKSLAGVGVVFYLLLALRAHLRAAGAFAGRAEPDLSVLLDLVALGTVADLVPLDANNRILVEAGLKRIRAGRCCAGIAALCKTAGRDMTRAVASDLGYALGPRINAAGRLDDMSLGIECLLTDDAERAGELAERLSAINQERQELQSTMVEQGEAMVTRFIERYRDGALPYGIVLSEPDWHPGVVGLVASKLKERLHRPVVACAPVGEGSSEWRGSARSIAGFHLRDALAEVDATCPGLIARFGGHAMAAGLSLDEANLPRFAAEFDAVARRRLDPELLEHHVWSDGELDAVDFTVDTAQALRYAGPWGQAFPEPAFDNVFEVESWRAVGERHLKMRLRFPDRAEALDAIMFNALEVMPPPSRLRAVYQLDLNEWNGRESLQLLVRHIETI
ncbi:single-stranded-DNA-specific exonuclease RecJ [Dokdonella soli]|uniref:Single-stranded-DNA-specific exonuclease RecJ n=1 Tax=Dokdonella soli TaxID=529810 RepID=A0ABN1IBG6_9GAMM